MNSNGLVRVSEFLGSLWSNFFCGEKMFKYILGFGILVSLAMGCSNSTPSEPNGNSDSPFRFSTLTQVQKAATDEQCPNGGHVLEHGVDSNGNGSLEAGEVIETYAVCNGEQGPAGQSCTVTQDETGATFHCGGTSASVSNGVDGANGADGVNGTDGVNGGDGWQKPSSTFAVNSGDVGGQLGVQTQDGQKDIAKFNTSESGAGKLELYNNSENLVISAGRVVSGGGHLSVYNESDPATVVAQLYSKAAGNGVLLLRNSYESLVVSAGPRAQANGGGGYFQVYNNANPAVAVGGIRHDGSEGVELWGTTKNFVENHPTQAGKAIVYTCVEGPEAAMYTRGTATLVDGEAKIVLPEHFSMMASYNGKMTVTLTPHSAESEGLARIELNPERLVVQELRNGTGTYEFDYEIKAIRYNREDHQVVQSWTKWAGPDAKNNSNPRGWRPRYK